MEKTTSQSEPKLPIAFYIAVYGCTLLLAYVIYYQYSSGQLQFKSPFSALTSTKPAPTKQYQPMTPVRQPDGSVLLMPVTSRFHRIVQGLEMQMLDAPACDYYLNAMKSVAYGSNPDNIKMLQLEKMVQGAEKAGCFY